MSPISVARKIKMLEPALEQMKEQSFAGTFK